MYSHFVGFVMKFCFECNVNVPDHFTIQTVWYIQCTYMYTGMVGLIVRMLIRSGSHTVSVQLCKKRDKNKNLNCHFYRQRGKRKTDKFDSE